MQKIGSLFAVTTLAFAGIAGAETFKNVPVVDTNCSKKVASNPDTHPRDCALKCEASGYGILTIDQKFLKFDAAGNKEAASALKASDKKDHLRMDVTGDVQGDTLRVTSLKLL